jgi:hypothetical protein
VFVAGAYEHLGAAGTLSVPNVPVCLNRYDLGVEPTASKQVQHLLLASAEDLERAPSPHASKYRKRNECSCNQVDGAAEGCPPARTGNILPAVLPQILECMPE